MTNIKLRRPIRSPIHKKRCYFVTPIWALKICFRFSEKIQSSISSKCKSSEQRNRWSHIELLLKEEIELIPSSQFQFKFKNNKSSALSHYLSQATTINLLKKLIEHNRNCSSWSSDRIFSKFFLTRFLGKVLISLIFQCFPGNAKNKFCKNVYPGRTFALHSKTLSVGEIGGSVSWDTSSSVGKMIKPEFVVWCCNPKDGRLNSDYWLSSQDKFGKVLTSKINQKRYCSFNPNVLSWAIVWKSYSHKECLSRPVFLPDPRRVFRVWRLDFPRQYCS